jgi:hypothetical protein
MLTGRSKENKRKMKENLCTGDAKEGRKRRGGDAIY